MDIKKTREDLRKGKTIYDMPLKVAYYARVSTDKEDQLNSLENQQNYFEEMIKENKNWIFCGGYIDEGISGTAVNNRVNFLRMLETATLGEIDLILTKEISRFSRNTIDSIKYTEYLLKHGVIVFFLSDNLNTIQEDSEFRLTIMSSLAQDEVRKLSERVKFGINRMIKDRKLIGGNLTGYYKKNGSYEINPNESPIITYLFEAYVSGKASLKKIGEDLAKMGYLNSKGKVYSQTTLAKFLTNPRYKGFYTARLTEVEDYKTHKKRKVSKEKQIIEKDNRIPAIVSEELWDKANFLYNERKQSSARHVLNTEKSLNTSKYSCLIHCKHCGNIYIRAAGSNRSKKPTWSCKTYKKNGVKTCSSPIIREEYLDNIFIDIFKGLLKNKKDYFNTILKEYENIKENLKINNDEEYNKQILLIKKQKEKLLDLSLHGLIDNNEFKKKNDKLNYDLQAINKKIHNKINCDLELSETKDIKNSLIKKINIKEQLPNLIKVLIEKIEVEKINNNRNQINIIISFNFKKEKITKKLNTDNKKISAVIK